ncbi:helix-turn-helix domain-containing protein [Dethiothermospora halolimnae]|uniref:helix-turn-helix domain-containing protein n=1 Tax=Dethiothermospora halolimnae TaxID=3114390 RepID=UPI003CCB9ED0
MDFDVDKIKIERAKQCLTLKQLAKKSKLNRDTLSRIENNRTNPRLITIAKIAKALGKELEHFQKTK